MYSIALKMLVGNRGKFVAMIFGVILSSFIIAQQMSIFTGLISRTIGFLKDTGQADLWVMDPKVQFIDDIKPLQDTKLYQVRGVSGVEWAVPLYKGTLRARLEDGTFQSCNVIGLDDASLIGGPPTMLQGSFSDLRRTDAVIVDEVGANNKLARKGPDGQKTPLRIGDILELNDNRAVVVGIARTTRTFQSQPVVYTTYSRATRFAPRERRQLSFIMIKAQPGQDLIELAKNISRRTGLTAYTADQFKSLTLIYFLKYTGIPINFGIAVTLGFLVGAAIVGQTFYSFTVDNLRYLGVLKAMGASNRLLFSMMLFQALTVSLLGLGLGIGFASLTSIIARNTELAFLMTWHIPVLAALAILLMALLAVLFGMGKVLKLEPGVVFRG